MDEKRPKRRKDRYNPYTLSVKEGKRFLSFKDGQGVRHDIEIEKDVFDMLNQFELDDLSFLNEWDRHIEQSEQTEQSINRRSVHKAESVEEAVLRSLEYQQLHKAISELPETQKRRLILYYFRGLTYEQIAEMEGCSHPAIIKSVSAAVEKIKKTFSE